MSEPFKFVAMEFPQDADLTVVLDECQPAESNVCSGIRRRTDCRAQLHVTTLLAAGCRAG